MYLKLRRLVADVKMNHVRGPVSIRNMAQGSDPACVGKDIGLSNDAF